jgi:Phage protein (N4 Gp49/phage Sf6 gene 66) family
MTQHPIDHLCVTGGPAPRITPAMLEDCIIAEHYFTAWEARMGSVVEGTYQSLGRKAGTDDDLEALKLVTFCVLVLENGFTVTGQSACASPANFNREIGQGIARKNAIEQMWPLLGYQLKSQLHNQLHFPPVPIRLV